MTKDNIICPHCKKKIDYLIYAKDEGWEDWKYPIKNGKLNGDNADYIKGEFHNCHWECPKCEEIIDINKIGLEIESY